MKYILLIFSFFLLGTNMQVFGQSFKIVVHNDNPITSISKSNLSGFFLKNTTQWDHGLAIEPVDQNSRSAVREEFSREVHGRSVGAIRSHWQQAAFSGAGTAPLERPGDTEILDFVRSNPGAIGYISTDTDAPGVKIIDIQ